MSLEARSDAQIQKLIPGEILTEVSSGIAPVKRFLERFVADPEFRERTVRTPDELAQRVRALWDYNWSESNALVEEYRSYLRSRVERRATARLAASPVQPRFRAWRERQMARCWSELGPEHGRAIVHHPAAFELNKGCSVGCWFCGVSAPKLGEIWDYSQNRSEWRATLGLFLKLLGPAASQSVLYWATDPLDNPDYEKFCEDFFQILGVFPPTTTALAARQLIRTRRLVERSRSLGCRGNRFSVLSLGQLKRIHEEFTAEDLMDVDLVLQNKGSLLKKSKSGRAREQGEGDFTIACVSGFLLNMVEGSIALVSPCKACDRFPDGFRVHARRRFETVSELEEKLAELVSETYMPERVHRDQVLKFRDDLVLSPEGLRSPHALHEISDRPLAQRIEKGVLTASQIALELSSRQPLEKTFFRIQKLFQKGLLAEKIHES